MKRLFIAALICFSLPALAFYGSRDSNYNVAISSASTFSISATAQQQEASGANPITYSCGSSCSFGASDPNRVIAVYIASRQLTVDTILSVTIGGNSAALVTGSNISNGTNGENSAVYYFALGAGATSGNIVVTFGAAPARTCISIYRIITSTPTPSIGANTFSATAVTSFSLTAAKPLGGGGLAGMYLPGASTGVSWTNASVDYNSTGGTSSQCSTANVSASNPSVSWTTAQAGVASVAMWGP